MKQRKPSNPPQDQPNGNPRADTSMIVPPTTPSEDNATANGKDSREKPNPAKPLRFWQDHNKVVAIATVVIAVVNAVYAVFAYWQWQEIKESNRINGISAGAAKLAANTARDTFVTTNRPYIGVYASKIQKQDCGSKDCDYLFRVTVKNFGPVPGDNFIFHYAVLSDGKPVTPLRGNFSPDVDQLWPGSTSDIFGGISRAVFADMFSGKQSFDVEIFVSYEGIGQKYQYCKKERYIPGTYLLAPVTTDCSKTSTR